MQRRKFPEKKNSGVVYAEMSHKNNTVSGSGQHTLQTTRMQGLEAQIEYKPRLGLIRTKPNLTKLDSTHKQIRIP